MNITKIIASGSNCSSSTGEQHDAASLTTRRSPQAQQPTTSKLLRFREVFYVFYEHLELSTDANLQAIINLIENAHDENTPNKILLAQIRSIVFPKIDGSNIKTVQKLLDLLSKNPDLFPQLTKVGFPDITDCTLTIEGLPDNVQSLSFNGYINKAIVNINNLPNSLIELSIFNIKNGALNLPNNFSKTNIKTVSINSVDEDSNINNIHSLPENLGTFKIGSHFKGLAHCTFPNTLKTLSCGAIYENERLNLGVIPKTLTHLNITYIGRNAYCYLGPLPKDLSIHITTLCPGSTLAFSSPDINNKISLFINLIMKGARIENLSKIFLKSFDYKTVIDEAYKKDLDKINNTLHVGEGAIERLIQDIQKPEKQSSFKNIRSIEFREIKNHAAKIEELFKLLFDEPEYLPQLTWISFEKISHCTLNIPHLHPKLKSLSLGLIDGATINLGRLPFLLTELSIGHLVNGGVINLPENFSKSNIKSLYIGSVQNRFYNDSLTVNSYINNIKNLPENLESLTIKAFIKGLEGCAFPKTLKSFSWGTIIKSERPFQLSALPESLKHLEIKCILEDATLNFPLLPKSLTQLSIGAIRPGAICNCLQFPTNATTPLSISIENLNDRSTLNFPATPIPNVKSLSINNAGVGIKISNFPQVFPRLTSLYYKFIGDKTLIKQLNEIAKNIHLHDITPMVQLLLTLIKYRKSF